MVLRASPIALSMAGKIWSPFTSVSAWLPDSSGGPSMTPIVRRNWGSSTVCSDSIRCSIFLFANPALSTMNTASRVAATLARTIFQVLVRLLAMLGCSPVAGSRIELDTRGAPVATFSEFEEMPGALCGIQREDSVGSRRQVYQPEILDSRNQQRLLFGAGNGARGRV